MKKTLSHVLPAGLLAAATLAFSAPAQAQVDRAAGCSYYQPGMLAFITGVRPAPCAYQGDYMVHPGPMYDGPARIAPQPTYAPARTSFVGDYPYVPGEYSPSMQGQHPLRARAAEMPVARKTVRRDHPRSASHEPVIKRNVKHGGKRKTVNIKNELPTNGKPKVVKARAEVRIYSTERMDIRLYRR